jgi:hypothetical protein
MSNKIKQLDEVRARKTREVETIEALGMIGEALKLMQELKAEPDPQTNPKQLDVTRIDTSRFVSENISVLSPILCLNQVLVGVIS